MPSIVDSGKDAIAATLESKVLIRKPMSRYEEALRLAQSLDQAEKYKLLKAIAEPSRVDILVQDRVDRRAFMQLSLQARHQLLAQQAEAIADHYQQDTEWRELEIGDCVEY